MSTVKADWQPESEDLALAKDMVKSILGDWDWISWNELLAFDVVLSLRMAPVWGDDLQTVDGVVRSWVGKTQSAYSGAFIPISRAVFASLPRFSADTMRFCSEV